LDGCSSHAVSRGIESKEDAKMADYDPPRESGCPMSPKGGGEVKARSLLGRTNKDW
jgi:hypothetical protein